MPLSLIDCPWTPRPWRSYGQLAALTAVGTALVAPLIALPSLGVPQPQPVILAQMPTQGGTSVFINGIKASLPWIINQGRLALADYGLVQHLGLTLLDSENPRLQPIQWFSSAPLNLPAQTQGGYRYLEVTPLVNRYGWTLSRQGSTLIIQTPPAVVQSIYRSTYAGGDRWVISLSGPAPVQSIETPSNLNLSLAASPSPNLIGPGRGRQPSAPLMTNGGSYTGLNLGLSPSYARPQISTQANPPQVTIDIRPDYLQPLNILWAPGLRWRQQYVKVGDLAFPVYWLDLTPPSSQFGLRPIWSDPATVIGTAPLSTIAARWQAAAAINGGFFNRNNQYPLGAIRYNRDWISGPILNRGAIAWDSQGQIRLDRLQLQQTLTIASGKTLPLQAINSGYVSAGIGLYTPAWGPQYRSILANETVVTVVGGRVVGVQPNRTETSAPVAIPRDGYLLVVRANAEASQALAMGSEIRLATNVLPATLASLPQVMAGGPLLIRQSTLVLDPKAEQFSDGFSSQTAPRSAIGLTARGHLLLVAVHLSPSGSGPTLGQLAQIMAQLGSTDALNLDGGSSASLYLGGQLINRPASTAARVNNGIGVFLP
ncbi:MAG: phosphodiester glycosidase family protein [Cyanobacteria bacterium REEB459]|nr:phosphodiester glycosidase family protein [Cyanobacteria bacterium REEB459]